MTLTPLLLRFNWLGCPIEDVDDTCNADLVTQFSDSPGWRQMAYDSINNVFYFCDYSPIKRRTVCFSTADGTTWNGQTLDRVVLVYLVLIMRVIYFFQRVQLGFTLNTFVL